MRKAEMGTVVLDDELTRGFQAPVPLGDTGVYVINEDTLVATADALKSARDRIRVLETRVRNQRSSYRSLQAAYMRVRGILFRNELAQHEVRG